MIKMTDGGPKDLLPPILKNDPDMAAYSYAIEMAVGLVLKFSRRIMMYANIDEMPESILDYMAVESRAQYYDADLDISTKREIIKNSLAWYMIAGTEESVNDLIRTIFGEGLTVPWYEFEDGPGTPGTFDIVTNARMTEDIAEQFLAIVEKAKNESSHIRRVLVHREVEGTEHAHVAATRSAHRPVLNSTEKMGGINGKRNVTVAAFGSPYVRISNTAETRMMSAGGAEKPMIAAKTAPKVMIQ